MKKYTIYVKFIFIIGCVDFILYYLKNGARRKNPILWITQFSGPVDNLSLTDYKKVYRVKANKTSKGPRAPFFNSRGFGQMYFHKEDFP